MKILLRPAIFTDASALVFLHATAIREIYGSDYPQAAIDDWAGGHTEEGWRKNIAKDDLSLPIACDESVIARCYGLDLGAHRLGVYVHPDYHRQGIGRRLAEAQLDKARKAGISLLRLSAPERAVPFYASLGFCPVSEKAHRFHSGAVITVIDMEYAL